MPPKIQSSRRWLMFLERWSFFVIGRPNRELATRVFDYRALRPKLADFLGDHLDFERGMARAGP